MPSKWVDFKEIKQKVSMEMVLDHYGLLGTLRPVKHGYRGACPVHGGSHSNQFHVDTAKNRWNCFGGCDMDNLEGHVIGFVAAMEKINLREAALLIADWFGLDTNPPAVKETKTPQKNKRPTKRGGEQKQPPQPTKTAVVGQEQHSASLSTEPEPENKPLTFELKKLDTSHPFFNERSIAPETIKYFGLGFCRQGLMRNRIVFPLHRCDGILIGYTGRTVAPVTDENPKWLVPPNLVKPKVLYNLHRVADQFNTAIIVEGPLDLVAVYQAGFPNVVALLGKQILADERLSYDQLRLLVNHFKGVVILLDGDSDGRQAASRCLLQLAPVIFARVVTIPDEKDPSDLAPQELAALLSFLK